MERDRRRQYCLNRLSLDFGGAIEPRGKKGKKKALSVRDDRIVSPLVYNVHENLNHTHVNLFR